MRCVEISTPGGPDVLKVSTRPTPYPGPEEVLIHVAYAGINHPDLFQRRGMYPPPPARQIFPALKWPDVLSE